MPKVPLTNLTQDPNAVSNYRANLSAPPEAFGSEEAKTIAMNANAQAAGNNRDIANTRSLGSGLDKMAAVITNRAIELRIEADKAEAMDALNNASAELSAFFSNETNTKKGKDAQTVVKDTTNKAREISDNIYGKLETNRQKKLFNESWSRHTSAKLETASSYQSQQFEAFKKQVEISTIENAKNMVSADPYNSTLAADQWENVKNSIFINNVGGDPSLSIEENAKNQGIKVEDYKSKYGYGDAVMQKKLLDARSGFESSRVLGFLARGNPYAAQEYFDQNNKLIEPKEREVLRTKVREEKVKFQAQDIVSNIMSTPADLGLYTKKVMDATKKDPFLRAEAMSLLTSQWGIREKNEKDMESRSVRGFAEVAFNNPYANKDMIPELVGPKQKAAFENYFIKRDTDTLETDWDVYYSLQDGIIKGKLTVNDITMNCDKLDNVKRRELESLAKKGEEERINRVSKVRPSLETEIKKSWEFYRHTKFKNTMSEDKRVDYENFKDSVYQNDDPASNKSDDQRVSEAAKAYFRPVKVSSLDKANSFMARWSPISGFLPSLFGSSSDIPDYGTGLAVGESHNITPGLTALEERITNFPSYRTVRDSFDFKKLEQTFGREITEAEFISQYYKPTIDRLNKEGRRTDPELVTQIILNTMKNKINKLKGNQ